MKRVYVEDFFDYKGYACVCVFNAGGFRCGYVAVDNTHPYYGKDYIDEGPNEIMCHYGLTYSGDGKHFCDGSDGFWWFGFDCGHYGDATDYDTAKEYGLISDKEHLIGKQYEKMLTFDDTTLKTKEFVEEICKMIVEQLIVVKKKGS